MHALSLPAPDARARVISAQLSALILKEISAHGPMPFQRYMDLALYAPGLGYYSAGARKFGARGDFVTAPELGSLFAEVLAKSVAPLLRLLHQPACLELGAGSGVLAADLLTALEARDALPERYLILERSADLRERQAQLLRTRVPHLAARVRWLHTPPVEDFEGVLIANEVVDALACARFRITLDGPAELGVQFSDGSLGECELPPRPHVAAALRTRLADLSSPLAIGYTSECVPELGAWVAAVAGRLRRGVAIFADYGYGRDEYYHQERRDGTLMCHYQHRVHADPFWYPGLSDITASVDFTALAEAINAAGFELAAYDTQAGFLIAAGIEDIHARFARASDRERLARSNELRRLMLPGEMGESFKILVASRGLGADQLPGACVGPGQRRRL